MNQEEINATKAHIKKTHKVRFVGNNPVVSGVYMYLHVCIHRYVRHKGVAHRSYALLQQLPKIHQQALFM